MIREEFIALIESIGFKKINDYGYYKYKEFKISLYYNFYNFYFYNSSEWNYYYYTDLTPIKENFKKELRSYKLKTLLYCNIS